MIKVYRAEKPRKINEDDVLQLFSSKVNPIYPFCDDVHFNLIDFSNSARVFNSLGILN